MTISYEDYIKKRSENADYYETEKLIKNYLSEQEQKKTKKKKKKKDTWFSAGAFEDGYDFGDLTKTTLSTAGDIGINAIHGAGSVVEGVFDLGSYGVAGAYDLFGNDKTADKIRKKAQKDTIGNLLQPGEDFFDKNSLIGEKGDQVSQGLGQVGVMIATGGAGASAGLGMAGQTAITTGLTFTSSMGSGMSEAYQSGATDEEAVKYGAIKGVGDASTELIFAGLGKTINAKGFNVGLSSADDMLARKVSSKINNQVARNFVEFGIKAGAEGSEEVLAGVISAVGKKVTYMSEEELGQILEDEKLLDQFIMGAVTSGFAQSGYIPGMQQGSLREANKTGRDFVTGYTQNEQRVIDSATEQRTTEIQKERAVEQRVNQVIAEREGTFGTLSDAEKKNIANRVKEQLDNGELDYTTSKLTKKEIAKIEAEVQEDFKKGYIDVDTIESTLSSEKTAQIKELEAQLDKTTNEQKKAEIQAQINEIKYARATEMSELLKNDGYLQNSYREEALKKQKFTYEATETDSDIRKSLAEDFSKIANDTAKTHELFETISKIAEDKQTSYGVINNEQLQELGYEVEGKTINGLVRVNADGTQKVLINIDSAKAINRIVGHETTHLLEGTNEYTELQEMVKEYAETKGDYSRLHKELTELYKGTNANIENELTADLVGDYLFTDTEFINQLSTKKPNIFQKIFNEIKHLYKLVTAGSKEARQLEKVKKAFEKAYRKNAVQVEAQTGQQSATQKPATEQVSKQVKEQQTDIELPTTENQVRELTKEQQEFFKDSVVRDEDGNLMVMYHGTSSGGHTAFDTYGSKYGLFGQGSYFTNDRSVAESYTEKGKGKKPQIYETYLNITNPIDMDAQADAEAWKKALPDADFPDSGTNEDFYRAMEEYYRDAEYSKWEASEEIIDTIQGMGYDGITHIGGGRFNKADDTRHRVYIAFESEQIKNIDNTKPTSDPDIRYSLSDNQGRELSEGQRKYFKDSKVRDENGNLTTVYHTMTDASKQFNEFNPVGTDYYKFGNQVVNFFTNDKAMSGSYADGSYKKANTQRFNTIDELKQWIDTQGFTIKGKPVDIQIEATDGEYKLGYVDEDGIGMSTVFDNLEDILRNYNEATVFNQVDTKSNYRNNYQYEGYLNITNPYIVDAEGRDWDMVEIDYDYETIDTLNALDERTKQQLIEIKKESNKRFFESAKDLTSEYRTQTKYFDEIIKEMDSVSHIDPYDLWKASEHEFKPEALEVAFSRGKETNDIVHEVLESNRYSSGEKYDGIIFKNVVDYGDGYGDPQDVYVTFASNQFKAVDNVNPTDDADIRYSLSDDVGYHYGDLGKGNDTYYWNMSQTRRSTGHFGTGTYFFGSESASTTSMKSENRPLHKVNFSDYNLMKPANNSEAIVLHEGLKALNNIDRFVDYYDEFDRLQTMLKKYGISEKQSYEAFYKTRDVYFSDEYKNASYDSKLDSLSTIFMKELGYNGIDVRGLDKFDNGSYGSVIYDLNNKKTDTRYSLSVDDYGMYHRPSTEYGDASNFEENMPDVFEHPEWYFYGSDARSKKAYTESFNALKKVRNNPEGEITIYRATIGDTINEGDWVTPSKTYAEWHNESQFNGEANILELKVKAKDIRFAGDDLNEFGYFPNGVNDYSLSNFEQQQLPSKNRNDIFGSDIKLQVEEAIAPIKEEITQLKEVLQTTIDDTAPVRQDIVEQQNAEAFSTINDSNIPMEAENTTPEDGMTPTKDLFETRDYSEVGNRKVNAYQYDNPEVKPYFQEVAKSMLDDLATSVKGERHIIGDISQVGNGDYQYIGTPRFTSDDIAELLDGIDGKYKMTYKDIEKGLNAIIKDEGAENNANSKRIEFYLDKRLREGYTTLDGVKIPANQRYINTLNGIEATEQYGNVPIGEAPVQDASNTEVVEGNIPTKNTLGYIPKDPTRAESYEFDDPVQDFINKSAGSVMDNKVTPAKENPKSKLRTMVDTFKGQFVNRNVEIDNLARESGNKNIKFAGDMYNNVAGEIETDVNTAQTNMEGKAIGKSIKQIFQPSKDAGLYEAFNDYLIQKSNIERHKQGKGSVIPSGTSQQLVNAYEKSYPIFKTWANDVYKYNRNILNNEVEAGLVSKDLANFLTNDIYPSYVPFYEVQDTSRYFDDRGELKPVNVLKRAKGGASKIAHIEESMIKQTYVYKRAIRQNQLYQQIVGTLGSEVSIGADLRSDPTQLNESLYVDEDGNKYLTAYVDGEQKSVSISDELYKSLKNESEQRIRDLEERYSLITKPLQKLSEIRRNLLTTWSPSFVITNPLKDIQDAVLNSKYTKDMIKNYPGAFKELAMGNTDTVKQFLSLYGSGNTMGEFDIEQGKVKNQKNIKFLSNLPKINNIVELAPRYAEFKASLENGTSVYEAMYNAREITTNFGRGGTITKALNRNGFTFLNASVQGMDKFIRNFSGENGAKGVVSSLAKAVTFGVLPALFNALAFDDDEEYEALPDYIKDNYYLIKTGDGEFVRIPKGRMISVFGSAGRRTLEYAQGEEDAFEGFFKNAYSQTGVSNPLTNNIFSPLIQAYGSENGEAWYGGDLVPSRLQDKPLAEQYDESTDEFSKWLGEKLNISPYKLNYVIDQYSGGIGDLILPTITEEASSDGSILAPLKDKFTANSTSDNKYVSDFYTTKEDLMIKANSSKATDEDILKYKFMNDINSEMNALYREKREVQNDSSLTKAEKYKKVQEIQRHINEFSEIGLNNYEDIQITENYATVSDRSYRKNTEGKWVSVDQDELNDIESFGMTMDERNSYFASKNRISEIDGSYDKLLENASEDEKDVLYSNKKREIISVIKDTNLNDEQKAYLYDKYYSSDKVLDTVLNAGIDFNTYLDYASQDFEADYYANGKVIPNSKKNKVISYVNSLNLSIPQKAILIRQQYSSFKQYNNQIVEYVSGLDLTYEEKVALLESLDITVDADGNVHWK